MCHQLFGNELKFYCVPIVTSIHKSSQNVLRKQLKQSLQLGNPSFLKKILLRFGAPRATQKPHAANALKSLGLRI